MSKITQALEKAATDRLRAWQEKPTVSYDPIAVASSGLDPHIVAYFDPKSPITEQYRLLRANLLAVNRQQPPRVIVMTSAINQEGKSLTSANLSVVMAQSHNREVLLVDADLHKGTIRRLFGLEKRAGLAEILEGQAEVEQCLVKTEVPQLTLLPAGNVPTHPTELLESDRMSSLLRQFRKQFDVVIVDAPPIIPMSDAGVIGQYADGVVLVVQAGRTQRKLVTRAHELLKQVDVKVLGFVLTQADYYVPYYQYYAKYYGSSEDRTSARPGAAAATSPTNGSGASAGAHASPASEAGSVKDAVDASDSADAAKAADSSKASRSNASGESNAPDGSTASGTEAS